MCEKSFFFFLNLANLTLFLGPYMIGLKYVLKGKQLSNLLLCFSTAAALLLGLSGGGLLASLWIDLLRSL